MNIVIIEDEVYAMRRLENLIMEYDPEIRIVARLESVQESIGWFTAHPEPDLIFLDIHLEDDLSFAIFNTITVSCPIVFTTATDELAVKAFTLKGVDFLHKPIVQVELNKMLEKYSHPGSFKKITIGKGYFDEILNKK